MLMPLILVPTTLTTSTPAALLTATGLLAAGIGVTYDAYRRWLLTDLG